MLMALHPAEAAAFRAFVVQAKRRRFLMLLGSARRRKRALRALNLFAHWDPRWVQPLPSSAHVLAALRAAGAPAECHLVTCSASLDGRDLPLADAVEAIEDFPFASLLCCLPGELACFFDEIAAPRDRILLRRRTPLPSPASDMSRRAR
jgi:hypothetical protein